MFSPKQQSDFSLCKLLLHSAVWEALKEGSERVAFRFPWTKKGQDYKLLTEK